MNNSTKIIFATLFITSTLGTHHKHFHNSLAHNIDQYLQNETDRGDFSGTVLVAKEGNIIFNKAYGMANYELNVPNTTTTKFRIASITKSFTAMAIMLLQERGLISIHDSLTKYIPEFTQADAITIHHLLTHSSGIVNYTSLSEFQLLKLKPTSLTAIIDLIKTKPLEFSPGDRFAYCNSGYILLAHIIEKVSGISYEQFMQENIFNPLEMNDSGYESAQKIIPNKALGYTRDDKSIQQASYIDMSSVKGASGLYSTVEDLYKWQKALHTEKLLTKRSLDMMMHPHIAHNKDDANCQDFYGYGFNICKIQGRHCITHSGGMEGARANFAWFPEEDVVLIRLSNVEFTSPKTFGTLTAILFGNHSSKQ